MRTFISIDIPEKIKKEIVKIQDSLPEFKGKKTELENLHLTLKFLGEVSEEKLEEAKKALKKIKVNSFETTIKDIGMFSDRIIWLKMANCNELQKQIDENLSDLFEIEKRFMGHLTIARIKELRERKNFLAELRKIKIPELKFVVKNFKLKKSKLGRPGPVYSDMEIFFLN